MILLIFNFEDVTFQKKGKWNYVYTLKLLFPVDKLLKYERKEVDIAEGLSNIIMHSEYEK